MSVCSVCISESVWVDYTGKSFCRAHFLMFVEKRIRKFLRLNKVIDLKKAYFLVRDSENKFLVLSYFLDKIFGNRLVYSLVDSSFLSDVSDPSQVILASSLDDEASVFLDFFLDNSEFNSCFVKPFCLVSNAELIVLGRVLNFDLSVRKSYFSSYFDKDSELLFSLHKSQEFVRKRIKK